jgi:hypothetical protein
MKPDQWTTSTHSGGNGCVAVADGDVVQVKDSQDPTSPVLTFDPRRWMEFIEAVKGAGL